MRVAIITGILVCFDKVTNIEPSVDDYTGNVIYYDNGSTSFHQYDSKELAAEALENICTWLRDDA